MAGSDHACVLARSGTVACWGSNALGELGVGSTEAQPRVVEVEGFHEAAQLQASMHRTCGWERDGSVACWGDLDVDVPVTRPFWLPVVQGLSGIAATAHEACGWFADGSIECIHRGPHGPVRTQVALPRGAVQIVAGLDHFCALDAAGTVSCWGGDGSGGQLGDPGRVARALPGPVPGLHDARDLVAAGGYACALRATGAIVCWGYHPLDGGAPRPPLTPVPHVAGAVRLAATSTGLCAVLADGTARCWGTDASWHTLTGEPEGHVPPFRGARAMMLDDAITCALGTDGHVQCLGKNRHGELGDGTTEARAEPVTVQGLSGVAQIATDGAQTCALVAGGTVRCWGLVGLEERAVDRALGPGHLGLDFLTGTDLPPARFGKATWATSPEEVVGLTDVVRLVGFRPRLCAVRRDGTVACWGFDDAPAAAACAGVEPRRRARRRAAARLRHLRRPPRRVHRQQQSRRAGERHAGTGDARAGARRGRRGRRAGGDRGDVLLRAPSKRRGAVLGLGPGRPARRRQPARGSRDAGADRGAHAAIERRHPQTGGAKPGGHLGTVDAEQERLPRSTAGRPPAFSAVPRRF